MKWNKKGLIYKPDGSLNWSQTHASIPTPFKIDDETLRIFFSSRNKDGESLPSYIDVNIDNPSEIKYIHDKPLLQLGRRGTFDSNGIMPSSVVNLGSTILMYYIGWNKKIDVSYELSIGLAVSTDGTNFRKWSEGPIMGRSCWEPIFATAPFVARTGKTFTMWFVSCTEWINARGRPEPLYRVCQAISNDGYFWIKNRKVAIDYKFKNEAIGRPWVIKEDDKYKMWYSTRGSLDYRFKEGQHYTIGYAESQDGITWERLDDNSGIEESETPTEWDYEMIEYCSIFLHKDKKYLFYNGNVFGKSGFGYAVSA